MFQQYQGGIAPIQGISEAGARIGQMSGSGLADMGKSLAEGIQAYHENTAKWDMVSGEADALASQVANTQKLFLSHPAYVPLAEALSPYVEQLSGVKSQSLPKALGTLNSIKAAYQGTMQQFPLYEAIRQQREYGAFGEGLADPNNTTNTAIAPVGTSPNDLKWDYTKTTEANIFSAGKYYDSYKSANPTVRLRNKQDWVKSWLSSLPNQIANDSKVDKRVRDKAIEHVSNAVSSNFLNFLDINTYLDPTGGIPERANPNAPAPQAINKMAGQPQAPASPYGNFSNKPITRYQTNPVTGEMEAIPQTPAGKPIDRYYPLAMGGFATGQPKQGDINAYITEKDGNITPYSQEILSFAATAGVEPREFVEGWKASGLTLDEYYQSITTPVGGADVVMAVPDKGTPAVRVPQNIVDYAKSLGVSIREFTDGWKASGLTVDEYYKSVSTPVGETVTPAVKAPSAQPKISPPTPAYSGKAQPAPAPAPKAQAPVAKAQAPAPAQAPVAKAPAPAPAPAVRPPEPSEYDVEAQPADIVIPEQLKPTETQPQSAGIDAKPPQGTSVLRDAPDPNAIPKGVEAPAFGKLSVGKSDYDEPSGNRLSSMYTISPDSSRYVVKNGEQIWQIANRMGVDRNAVTELNGIPLNITPADLFKVSNQRGGLYVPTRVKKEDLPENLRKNPKIVMSGSSGGKFGAILPPLLSKSPEMKEEEPQATGNQSSYVAPLGAKEITPVGQGKVSPEQDEANRVASGMSKDDWAKVKVSRSHLQAQQTDAWNKRNAYRGGLDWLKTIRDSVADGSSDLVDYGPYGQWESVHPDLAMAVQVGFDAGTILIGASKINKIQKAKTLFDREKMVADSAKKAFEAIKKARADELAKGPKMIGAGGRVGAELERRTANRIASDEAKLFEKALKDAGVNVDSEIRNKIAGMNKDIYMQMGKSTFWTSVFEGMYGTRNASPDSANNDPETRIYLNNTLTGIRKLRTGYTPFGFGQGEGMINEAIGTWKPLTGKEQIDIVRYLDDKIAQGQAKHDNYDSAYKDTWTYLSDNQKLLSKFGEISSDSPSADQVDTAYRPSAPLGTQSSIIGSRSFTVEKTTDEKRLLLKNFMQKRLGYVPQGFDSMFNTQFPEATLKMQETPYGVMYHDGKGEWRPLPTQKGSSTGFSDMAKEKSVVFGQPLGDGTFKPTEFIKGSGIKIGGVGAFGSAEAASKFRETYPKLIVAKKIAMELKALNEQTFRSFDPENWGKAAAKVSQLIAQMRVALIGVGSVSDFEQQLMRDLVQDPTAFFSLQSSTRSKYQGMIDNIDEQITTMPQSFGLTVELDQDKAKDLLSARRAYQESLGWSQLTAEQRAQVKAKIK